MLVFNILLVLVVTTVSSSPVGNYRMSITFISFRIYSSFYVASYSSCNRIQSKSERQQLESSS